VDWIKKTRGKRNVRASIGDMAQIEGVRPRHSNLGVYFNYSFLSILSPLNIILKSKKTRGYQYMVYPIQIKCVTNQLLTHAASYIDRAYVPWQFTEVHTPEMSGRHATACYVLPPLPTDYYLGVLKRSKEGK